MSTFKNKLIGRVVVLLLAFAMVVTTVPFSMLQIDAAETKTSTNELKSGDVETTERVINGCPVLKFFFKGHVGYMSDRWALAYYSDGFFRESTTEYNNHLATFSATMVSAGGHASDSTNIKNFMKNIWFKDIETKFYEDKAGYDDVGCALSHKTLYKGESDQCELVAVTVKSGKIKGEWSKALLLGENGDAQGFDEKSDVLIGYLEKYCKDHGIDMEKAKFWVTGHSEGGAVANIAAKKLSDKYTQDKVFGYTTSALHAANVTKEQAEDYKNIFNTENVNDLYHVFFPSYYGMSVYGKNIEIADITDTDFKTKETKMRKQLETMVADGDDETDVFSSPDSFTWNTLELDAEGLWEIVTEEKYTKKGPSGNPRECVNVMLSRIKSVASTRDDFLNYIPNEVQAAAEKLDVQPYSIQDCVVKLMKYFNSGEEKGGWKDDIDDIKGQLVGLVSLHLPFLTVTLEYLEEGELEYNWGHELIGQGYRKSYADYFKKFWEVCNDNTGLNIDSILDTDEYNELMRIAPMAVWVLIKIVSADYQSKGGHQAIGGFIGNFPMFEMADSKAVYLAYLRSEDDLYQNIEPYYAMQSGVQNVYKNNRICETRITGINGQTLEGTKIKLIDKAGTTAVELTDGKISGGTITSAGVYNSDGKTVSGYAASLTNDEGKVIETSLFANGDGYIVDMETTNTSEDKPYKYRIQRYWFNTVSTIDKESLQNYKRVCPEDNSEDAVTNLNNGKNHKSEQIIFDYIDVDLYKNQKINMKADNQVTRIGKYVKPIVNVQLCGKDIDSSIVTVSDAWETDLVTAPDSKYSSGVSYGLLNKVKFSLNTDKYGDSEFRWFDNDEESSDNKGNKDAYFSYDYDSKNPTVALKIYDDEHDVREVVAKDATCTEAGNPHYWTCDNCGKCYSDEACTQEITDLSSLIIPANGHKIQHVDKHEATCSEYGNIECYFCPDCCKYFKDAEGKQQYTTEEVYSVVLIPKKDHTFTEKTTEEKHLKSAATCTEPAKYYVHCAVCGENSEETFDSGNALGHAWNPTTEITKEPTCTANGTEKFTCITCGETKTESIPATGHTIESVLETTSDCLTPGTIACWHCSDCDHYFSDELGNNILEDINRLKPLSNVHVYDSIEDDKYIKDLGNCETNKTYYKSCTVCGKSSKEIEGEDTTKYFVSETAKGHDFEHGTEIERVESTCTKKGHVTYKCKNCEETKVFELDYAKHTLDKTNAVAETCTKDGNIEYWTCSKCNKIFKDADGKEETTLDKVVMKAHGHEYVQDAKASNALKATANCQSPAVYYETCKHCGERNNSKTFTLGTKGQHIWNNGKTTQNATCLNEGTKLYTCTIDGCNETKTETISKVPHALVVENEIAATKSNSGQYKHWRCENCGHRFHDANATLEFSEDSWKIPMLKKTFSDILIWNVGGRTYNGKYQGPRITTTLKYGTDYTYTKPGKYVGTYKSTVTLGGNYEGSKVYTYKIVPKGTKFSKLKRKKKAIYLRWTRQRTQTTGYQIRYSLYSSMRKAKTVTIKNTKTYSKTIKKLKSKKYYYFQIRTYKKGGYYSAWSVKKKVKTK